MKLLQGSAFSFGRTSNGVIPNVMETLFSRIADVNNDEYTVRVGFVEIHQVLAGSAQMANLRQYSL